MENNTSQNMSTQMNVKQTIKIVGNHKNRTGVIHTLTHAMNT